MTRTDARSWSLREAEGGATYVVPLPEPEDASVWFFSRLGGVSGPPYESLNVSTKVGDTEEAVSENLTRIRSAMNGNESAWVRQVAGDKVFRVDLPGLAGEGDALVTSGDGLSLVVAVADCVPVALVSPDEVGMVHSGWRGTISGVSGNAVAEMSSQPGNVTAYIGPSIRRCCYEVSEEIAASFEERFGEGVADGRYISLQEAIRRNLEEAGVGDIHDLGICTGCRSDLFYSHRKEKPATGRTLAAVARAPRKEP
ncbi:MAG: peptidoglycan editing factor PgeF [Rubrobacter sp.]|nr:peptidoglycan editing factor PgeF [Rubrobacter sp.]